MTAYVIVSSDRKIWLKEEDSKYNVLGGDDVKDVSDSNVVATVSIDCCGESAKETKIVNGGASNVAGNSIKSADLKNYADGKNLTNSRFHNRLRATLANKTVRDALDSVFGAK